MYIGWTLPKVGIWCREVRVSLFEKIGFKQTFEGDRHEEFSNCRTHPVQRPQGESIPEIFEENTELRESLIESTQRRIQKETPEK